MTQCDLGAHTVRARTSGSLTYKDLRSVRPSPWLLLALLPSAVTSSVSAETKGALEGAMKAGFVSLGAAILLVMSSTGVANAQSKVKGVDVSEYQGTIDWASVKSAGIGFGIARVSDGAHHSDAYFASNWSGMKKNGIIRGVYQFFRASQDPKAQAKVVADAVGSLGADDLPPVADVEVM